MNESRNGKTDSTLRRRFEPLVVEAYDAAWLKLADGRFLALSARFADHLGVAMDDVPRAFDTDVFTRADARRFRHDDGRVIAVGRPRVFLEPPDGNSPGAWFATLKIPVRSAVSGAGVTATLGLSYPVDALEPLRQLTADDAPALDDLAQLARAMAGGRDGGRRNRSRSAIAHRVRDRLDEQFRDKLRVSALARALGLHPDYLARCFRRGFGITMAQYVKARRVAWAASRLAASERPVVDVALAAGFCDQSHLTRAFREVLDATPARYRRRPPSAGAEGVLREARTALDLASRTAALRS